MPAENDTTFEAVARAYELLVNEQSRWERERAFLRSLIEASIGSAEIGEARVLDLGCGTGFHARNLAGCFGIGHVIGVDPSTSMLEVATGKEYGSKVTWLAGSAEDPPLPPDGCAYDLVLLVGNTFSLIRDVCAVLRAVAGVTRSPGGIFLIQMLDYDRLRAIGQQVVQRSNEECRILKHLNPVAGAESGSAGIRLGAELSLEVQSVADGRLLDRQENLLYEHPEGEWIEAATAAGWTITERRAGYGPDPTVGADRIFVLRREG